MTGLIGLGIGAALGFSVFTGDGSGPLLGWFMLGASYVLVYLWGRRRRGGSSTAVAIAVASAESTAAAQSNVNVFVGLGARGPGPQRVDELQAVSWRDDARDHELDRTARLELESTGSEVDDVDPVELLDRIRRGESVNG